VSRALEAVAEGKEAQRVGPSGYNGAKAERIFVDIYVVFVSAVL